MNPALSVILLTTLIGAGQGLFVALYVATLVAPGRVSPHFAVVASAVSATLLVLGLVASFFHLGRPERAWRAAARWRTSWLSREVIVLPAFTAAVFAYGVAQARAPAPAMEWIGAAATLLCVTLFVCTGMIYACIRFLQEWATPLTVVNYTLLGCASGAMLATALAAYLEPALVPGYAAATALATLAGLATRTLSLVRNARLRPKSTVQTAIGIKHPSIRQISPGFTGSSFNTREFFHHRTREFLRAIRWLFLVLAFPLPLALLWAGTALAFPFAIAAAFAIQYAGLLAERWFFFAQANHPQNLYYGLTG
ncbi:MAG TPA: DmsC/YnfH family molybdoenzyme membrane anchor subunit [Casimicrobiaceae bacterium]|nr:DmsC/YnfH family molybdoenzyme membrane anchor subunit [Casimicrobiaceae bacterium]